MTISASGLVQTRVLRDLGLMCDSGRAVCRVASDNLGRINDRIRRVRLDVAVSLFKTETIGGRCMSKKVAIRPASLWTYYMFEPIRKVQCPHHRFWQHRVRVLRTCSLREEPGLLYRLT